MTSYEKDAHLRCRWIKRPTATNTYILTNIHVKLGWRVGGNIFTYLQLGGLAEKLQEPLP